MAPGVFLPTTTLVSTTPLASAVTVPATTLPTLTRTLSPGFHPGPEVTSTVVPVGPEVGESTRVAFSRMGLGLTTCESAPVNVRVGRPNVVSNTTFPDAEPHAFVAIVPRTALPILTLTFSLAPNPVTETGMLSCGCASSGAWTTAIAWKTIESEADGAETDTTPPAFGSGGDVTGMLTDPFQPASCDTGAPFGNCTVTFSWGRNPTPANVYTCPE